MIDGKRLIDELKQSGMITDNDYGNTMVDMINQQSQIGGWILCSERLPEVFDNVLVCTKEGGRAIAHRCPNQAAGRYYDLHSSAIDGVTAWQPLPEPHKG